MEETVTISKREYNRLVKDQRFLIRLEAAGVDHWACYDDCLEADDDEDED